MISRIAHQSSHPQPSPPLTHRKSHISSHLGLLSIRRQPLQAILPLPPHLPRPTRINPKLFPISPQTTITRRRTPQARLAASTIGYIALHAAGPDVGGGGIIGIEVGFDGWIVGEREVGLAFGDDFGLCEELISSCNEVV